MIDIRTIDWQAFSKRWAVRYWTLTPDAAANGERPTADNTTERVSILECRLPHGRLEQIRLPGGSGLRPGHPDFRYVSYE